MKLKIIYASMTERLEEKVNRFIKDKEFIKDNEIVSISFSTSSSGFYAYILYKE